MDNKCRACQHDMADDEDLNELGLCAMCADLNYWANEEGYANVRRALIALEELGSLEAVAV